MLWLIDPNLFEKYSWQLIDALFIQVDANYLLLARLHLKHFEAGYNEIIVDQMSYNNINDNWYEFW